MDNLMLLLAITIQMHCNMTGAVSMQCWSPSGYHRDVMWRLRGLVQTHLTLNMTSCIHHVACVCPAVKLLNKISHLRVAYVCSSGTIRRPSVGIVLASASCVAQGPSSYEIQHSIFVWPSGVNFGTVWRQHKKPVMDRYRLVPAGSSPLPASYGMFTGQLQWTQHSTVHQVCKILRYYFIGYSIGHTVMPQVLTLQNTALIQHINLTEHTSTSSNINVA